MRYLRPALVLCLVSMPAYASSYVSAGEFLGFVVIPFIVLTLVTTWGHAGIGSTIVVVTCGFLLGVGLAEISGTIFTFEVLIPLMALALTSLRAWRKMTGRGLTKICSVLLGIATGIVSAYAIHTALPQVEIFVFYSYDFTNAFFVSIFANAALFYSALAANRTAIKIFNPKDK